MYLPNYCNLGFVQLNSLKLDADGQQSSPNNITVNKKLQISNLELKFVVSLFS